MNCHFLSRETYYSHVPLRFLGDCIAAPTPCPLFISSTLGEALSQCFFAKVSPAERYSQSRKSTVWAIAMLTFCLKTLKLSVLYVIYTNRGRGLYQIYKPEAKPSVHRSDINRTPRFVYCF